MEQWEQDALGEFQQQFSRMPQPPSPGGSPLSAPQQSAVPGQPPAQPGTAGLDMGQVIKDEVLSGPIAQYGRGALRGAADLGDSVIGLGQRAMGGEPTKPLGSAVSEHIDPHFAGATTNANFPPGRMAAGAANFAGEVTAPLVAGGKAVQAVAGGLGKIAPASSRLQAFINSFRNYGAGPAPLPAAGNLANTGMRVAGGAAAGGVAAAAGDPDNPGGMALGAASGGIVGPAGQKIAEGVIAGGRMAGNVLLPSRVPQLRDSVIRDVVGDRSAQVLNNLAQAPNRITPGLPHQVAADPGVSSLHRTLSRATVKSPNGLPPARYGDRTTDFLDRQAGDLAASLANQSAKLPQHLADRDAATTHLFKQLNESQQPVSLLMPARKAFSRILPGGDLQGSKQGKHLIDAAKPLIVPQPAGAPIPPVLPKGRGLLQQAPAGVLSNIKQDINAMLRAEYQPKPGRVKLDDAGKGLLLDFKASLDEALNRASPAKGDASRLNRQANREYQRFSVPVNQTRAIKKLHDDSLLGTKTMHQADQIDPTRLANSIRDMEQNPKVWGNFTNEQRRWLKQIQTEAPANVATGSYGVGTAADEIAKAAVPKAVLSSTRPLPGPAGRATSVAAKLIAGRRMGRVEDALAEIMSTPGGVAEIEHILRTQPQLLMQASGATPKLIQRGLSATLPMLTQ